MLHSDNDNALRIDPKLKDFATERQVEVVDAVNELGVMQAAKRLGVTHQAVQGSLKALMKRAAAQGYAPGHWRGGVAAGYRMGKVTVQRGPDGAVERVWERQHPEIDPEELKAMVAGFALDVSDIIVPEAPLDFQSDIIPWIQIGDAHLGMLAHAAETGQNFDLKIAENELCGAIGILIDELPSCERLVINDVGDFTHYENMAAVTEASGHSLDADGRFPKMIKVYSRVMRWIVDKALTKAKYVDVIINQGNHSRTNDIWMAELLRVAYGDNGRVNVLNNDSVFIGYRMGNTFVMIHHSDKTRGAQQLAGVMTTDFRQDYGETEFHYIDTGHVHHKMVSKEHPGVIMESFNILAPMDKYAHDNGYRSRQAITIVLRSRTYGEVGRRVLPIQEVWARLSMKSTPPRRAFAA